MTWKQIQREYELAHDREYQEYVEQLKAGPVDKQAIAKVLPGVAREFP